MILSIEVFLLIASILFFISMLVGKAGSRFGIPVLLLFLVVGMLFGSDGFGLQFENIEIAQFIGTIALCLILFSGGLDTKFNDIRPVLKQGITLATLGVLLTAFFTGLFAWWISKELYASLGVGFLTAMLLGAVTSSTDSASVFGILRSRNVILKNNLRPMLELESGSNDPLAYMLTITLISIIEADKSPNIFYIVLTILLQIAIGALVGYFLGKLSVKLINKIKLDNTSLYPILVFTLGVFIFSITYFLHGNGYLAVYIMGLVLASSRFVQKRTSLKFMDGLAWMSQIVLFLTLGLLVNPNELIDVLIPGLLISFFIIFVSRPLSVFIALSFFKNVKLKDKIFISWVGLRGAVPILFAILALAAQIAHARDIFNIVFIITLVSLITQGASLTIVAKWLKLSIQPKKYKDFEDFDIEFSEEIKSAMTEVLITEEALSHGKNLVEMPLPDNTLAVMIKRGDRYFIPRGNTELHVNDKLLVISDDEKALKQTYRNMGISEFSYLKHK